MPVEQSESITKLCAAMVAASAELKNPPKDSVNPHFKSRFADLATVIDTVKPTLTKHKLAVIQLPTESNGLPALATMLTHESGEWIRTTMLLCAAKSDPQGIGSAITYARRYGLQAALNITADDDDDGHQGSQPARPQQQRPAPPSGVNSDRKVEQQKPAPVDNGSLKSCSDAIQTAKSLPELKKAWDYTQAEEKAGAITKQQLDSLIPVKDAAKARLTNPQQGA